MPQKRRFVPKTGTGLPLLTSSLFPTPTSARRGRLALPILDPEASIRFFLCAREENRALLQQFC